MVVVKTTCDMMLLDKHAQHPHFFMSEHRRWAKSRVI